MHHPGFFRHMVNYWRARRVASGQPHTHHPVGTGAIAVLTVRNGSAEPRIIQLDGMSWSQSAGEDIYVPTRELLVTPAYIHNRCRGHSDRQDGIATAAG